MFVQANHLGLTIGYSIRANRQMQNKIDGNTNNLTTYKRCRNIELITIIIDRRIYLNLFKLIQSAAGLKALKPAANGR